MDRSNFAGAGPTGDAGDSPPYHERPPAARTGENGPPRSEAHATQPAVPARPPADARAEGAPARRRAFARLGVAMAAPGTLAACGVGEIGPGAGPLGAKAVNATGEAPATPLPKPPAPAAARPLSQADAARFLVQATFGPTESSVNELWDLGYLAWMERQFALPQSLHRTALEAVIDPAQPQVNFRDWVLASFWKQALSGADQLRQRVVFALSEIFVISQNAAPVSERPRGTADYLDMLGRNAFGNFRTLLQGVSLHPMMGLYLSHLGNRKEDPALGRVPDENYAREVMQLFSIGLYRLNPDGTRQLDANSQPISNYGNTDVQGLARVFTGWSWAGPDTSEQRYTGRLVDPNRDVTALQNYPQWHSTSAKSFLGVTIPASTPGGESLRIALDTLFNHPSAAPFIARQLIQRLVASNPSPAYVGRVAAAFANNGAGVRGDMKAVLRAILLDGEARDPLRLGGAVHGKVREPVLRLSAWARATGAASVSGNFLIRDTSSASTALGQTPLRSPSVFNFFRPGYVPPNSAIATENLVAPELQIAGETSVAAYLNFMRTTVNSGVGASSDVRTAYVAEQALADRPDQLLDRINLLLLAGQMTPATRAAIRAAVESVPLTATEARLNRAKLAVYLALASPEFIVQR